MSDMRAPLPHRQEHDVRVPSAAVLLGAVFITFAAVAALEASHAWLGQTYGYVSRANLTTARGPGLAWGDLFQRQLASWWIFALCAVPVVMFTRRRPIDPDRLLRTILPHAAVSFCFATVVVGATTVYRYFIFLRGETALSLTQVLFNRLSLYFATDLVYYWAIVGTYSAFLYYGLYRERALNEARLGRSLSEAQLSALQAQLQPHFLFNTLNAISGYAVQRNHDAVIGMLTRLSDLLRATFRHQPTHLIPLREELDLLRSYTELQQMRLGSRLRVDLDVADAALAASVPPLVLQPVVDSAIREHLDDGGITVIRIVVRCDAGELTVDVHSGSVVEERVAATLRRPAVLGGQGSGYATTAERLQLIYGPVGRLDAHTGQNGATHIRIRLPFPASAARSNGVPA